MAAEESGQRSQRKKRGKKGFQDAATQTNRDARSGSADAEEPLFCAGLVFGLTVILELVELGVGPGQSCDLGGRLGSVVSGVPSRSRLLLDRGKVGRSA